jgi:hypothetical protein
MYLETDEGRQYADMAARFLKILEQYKKNVPEGGDKYEDTLHLAILQNLVTHVADNEKLQKSLGNICLGVDGEKIFVCGEFLKKEADKDKSFEVLLCIHLRHALSHPSLSSKDYDEALSSKGCDNIKNIKTGYFAKEANGNLAEYIFCRNRGGICVIRLTVEQVREITKKLAGYLSSLLP